MVTDLRSRLESSFGHSYTIERELGGGGMARVFVAVELALGRRVVIKVLSPELAADVSTLRFQREIKLAASLQQANIVPVLTAGETDGLPHYTMPFVEGLSLRDKLATGQRLPIVEAIGILRDVARALGFAHERGVVHRDIKPENVLLSGDAAVVTDFGIAKAIASARRGANDGAPLGVSVTVAGTAVGTPAYMAPEQISMDPDIDHRADLYSFGCLAYELLHGQPPFAARSLQALFAAHLGEPPVALGERNPDTPPQLAALVMQCLRKEPADRPQSAREILRVLESSAVRASPMTRFLQGRPRGQRVAMGVALAIAMVTVATAVVARNIRPPALASIAVVPFLNVSGDSADEYLADGMADGLATALGKVSGIRIASRSFSYRYKGRRVIDARDVGKELSVEHVLHGAVRRAGNRLRVSAQLLSAGTNAEVWSESYDRDAVDAFAVQDDITRQIVAALGARLARGVSRTVPAVAGTGTSNPDAYDLYLRGRYLLARRGRGVRQATEKFQQAIASDSGFARAHAALAFSLELLTYFETLRTDSIGRLAVAAARRALMLDSTLGEAHTALGLTHQHAYEWQLAEAEHRQALSLDQNDADAHIQFGRLLHYTGRLREAQAEFARARELDPYSAAASGWLGHLMELRGKPREGLVELRRALEIDSTSPPALHMMSDLYLFQGDTAQAKAYAEQLSRRVPLPLWQAIAAATLARAGDSTSALAVLQRWEAAPDATPQRATVRSVIYVGLRDTTAALNALERATALREPWPTWYSLSERRFDILRASPRFRNLVRAVRLDDQIFTSPDGGRSR